MIKRFVLFLVLFNFFSSVQGQWSGEWSTGNISSTTASGWLSLQKDGDEWLNYFYVVGTENFQVMQSAYSNTPLYTYTFTASEVLAGGQVYSLGVDLTGDNITEFYVLGFYGNAEPYRQSMKIFDITTGIVLFERNDAAFYFSYPVIWDADNDGILECTFVKFDYPNFAGYIYEVYNTSVATSLISNTPIQTTFILDQNYPNPFNPNTNINYSIDNSERVILSIYDAKGELVKTLVNEEKYAGEYSINWDGTNHNGLKVSSGTYFYQVKAGQLIQTKKMVMIK
jgi:hypothetical protein